MEEPNRRTLLKGGLLSFAGMAGLPSLARAVQDAATPYRRPKLKITDIRTAEVRVHGYQVHVRVYTEKGIIVPPERPGIGVEMNDDAARKAQVPGTPWFEPGRRA